MQRARRLASIAAIVVVGVIALSGCRSEPGVAAYLGNSEITEDRLDAILDELTDGAQSQSAEPTADPQAPQDPMAPPPQEQPSLPSRSTVLSTLVVGGICERLAADEGFQPQNQVTPEQVAPQLGISPDSEYARKQAELYTCISGVPSGTPVAPTDEDLTEIVERGRAAGVIPADMTDADAKQRLDGDQLRGALGSRAVLADAVAAYDVTVNPRYRPLEFPVLGFQGNIAAVSVPLGEGDPGIVVNAD